MKTILDGYYRLLQIAITVLMAVLIVPVSMQILSRYTGIIPRYIWTEEIARFCFVWIIMVGAIIAVRDGTHFVVEVLPEGRTAARRLFWRMVVHVCMLAFAVVFLIYGYQWARSGAAQRSEIVELPMLTIYIAWPLAALSWMVFIVERIVADRARYREELAAEPRP